MVSVVVLFAVIVIVVQGEASRPEAFVPLVTGVTTSERVSFRDLSCLGSILPSLGLT